MKERALYINVEKEMNDGIYDEELWRKALEDNGGDEAAAQKEYIEFRVAQLQQDDVNAQQQDENINAEISHKKERVNKKTVAIGLTILFILVVFIVFLGFLLNDYFN